MLLKRETYRGFLYHQLQRWWEFPHITLFCIFLVWAIPIFLHPCCVCLKIALPKEWIGTGPVSNTWVQNEPYPFLFCSVFTSSWQQLLEWNPDIVLLSNTYQLLQDDPKTFSGQVNFSSATGSLWVGPDWETSTGRHPIKWLNHLSFMRRSSSTLSASQMTAFIILSPKLSQATQQKILIVH